MTPDAPQVLGTYKKNARRFSLTLTAVAAVGAGCEGAPARSGSAVEVGDSGREGEVGSGPAGAAIQRVLGAERQRLEAMAVRRDTLTVWLDSDPHTLDPLVAPTAWTLRITSDTVFEALVRYRPGESDAQPGGYEARLARSWRVGAYGREIAFELQPGVHFHDGRAMTALDVQQSIESARRGRGKGGAPLGAELADVLAIDVLGPATVRVRLARPNAYALRALAEVPIMPAPPAGHSHASGQRTEQPPGGGGSPASGQGPPGKPPGSPPGSGRPSGSA